MTEGFCSGKDTGLVCGHPLPCPKHTVILEGGKVFQPPQKILTRKQYKRLKEIAICQECGGPMPHTLDNCLQYV